MLVANLPPCPSWLLADALTITEVTEVTAHMQQCSYLCNTPQAAHSADERRSHRVLRVECVRVRFVLPWPRRRRTGSRSARLAAARRKCSALLLKPGSHAAPQRERVLEIVGARPWRVAGRALLRVGKHEVRDGRARSRGVACAVVLEVRSLRFCPRPVLQAHSS